MIWIIIILCYLIIGLLCALILSDNKYETIICIFLWPFFFGLFIIFVVVELIYLIKRKNKKKEKK